MIFREHDMGARGANFYCVSYYFEAFSMDRARKYVLLVLKLNTPWIYTDTQGFYLTSSILHLYFHIYLYVKIVSFQY